MLVSSRSVSRSGDVSSGVVLGGCVAAPDAWPVALTSLRQPPGQPCRYAYLVLVRRKTGDLSLPRLGDAKSSLRSGDGDEGPSASISAVIELGPAAASDGLPLRYAFDAHGELLELGGEARDLAKGRVFLLDLRREQPTVEQLDLPLPTLEQVPTNAELGQRLPALARELGAGSAPVQALLE